MRPACRSADLLSRAGPNESAGAHPLTTVGLVFALVVKFELQDSAKAAAFDQLVAETVRDIAEHESGTLVYATHLVEGEPLARVFYEVYRDRAAFDDHERQPHTRRFLERRGEFIADFRVEFLTPGVAKGIAGA